jgi:hypothetical protein
MNRNFKQWWATIPPISTKQTISPINQSVKRLEQGNHITTSKRNHENDRVWWKSNSFRMLLTIVQNFNMTVMVNNSSNINKTNINKTNNQLSPKITWCKANETTTCTDGDHCPGVGGTGTQMWRSIFVDFEMVNNSPSLNIKNTTTYDVGNSGPSLGQSQKCGRVKPVNRIPTLPSW